MTENKENEGAEEMKTISSKKSIKTSSKKSLNTIEQENSKEDITSNSQSVFS